MMESFLNCTISNTTSEEVICNGTTYYSSAGEGGDVEKYVPPSSYLFWVYLAVYLFLVLFAGKLFGFRHQREGHEWLSA